MGVKLELFVVLIFIFLMTEDVERLSVCPLDRISSCICSPRFCPWDSANSLSYVNCSLITIGSSEIQNGRKSEAFYKALKQFLLNVII